MLGATAAQRLGIHDVTSAPRVYVTGNWFDVVGILNPITLLPNLDSGAFIGYPIAEKLFAAAPAPDTVFVVTAPDQVDAVRGVLGATANPQSPGEVSVSRPSDAIAAKNAASNTLTALLLGLGGIALIVGGIGIANVMVISVLERRTEIGVRRALGATKRHVRLQFLVEAMLLSALGGAIGVVLGIGITIGYTQVQHIVLSIPAFSLAAGIGAALLVGAIAGISPAAALHASHPPTRSDPPEPRPKRPPARSAQGLGGRPVHESDTAQQHSQPWERLLEGERRGGTYTADFGRIGRGTVRVWFLDLGGRGRGPGTRRGRGRDRDLRQGKVELFISNPINPTETA